MKGYVELSSYRGMNWDNGVLHDVSPNIVNNTSIMTFCHGEFRAKQKFQVFNLDELCPYFLFSYILHIYFLS